MWVNRNRVFHIWVSLVGEYLICHAEEVQESFKGGIGIRGRENQGMTYQLTPAALKVCSFKLKIRSRFLIVEIDTVDWKEVIKNVIVFFFYSSDTFSFSNFELTVFAGKLWCLYLKNITPHTLISYKQPPILEANVWAWTLVSLWSLKVRA